MKEHNLPEIAKLYLEMEAINGKIKEARERAPDLLVMYMVEPFEAADKAGNLNTHHSIDSAATLGLMPAELRSAVIMTIETCLYNRIAEIKVKLRKLGVKLEEPVEPKPKEPLRLTFGTKVVKAVK